MVADVNRDAVKLNWVKSLDVGKRARERRRGEIRCA
jgi:hypothetical protein